MNFNSIFTVVLTIAILGTVGVMLGSAPKKGEEDEPKGDRPNSRVLVLPDGGLSFDDL
jgi:hypothetical protein